MHVGDGMAAMRQSWQVATQGAAVQCFLTSPWAAEAACGAPGPLSSTTTLTPPPTHTHIHTHQGIPWHNSTAAPRPHLEGWCVQGLVAHDIIDGARNAHLGSHGLLILDLRPIQLTPRGLNLGKYGWGVCGVGRRGGPGSEYSGVGA
jgi:hypothetical protein